MYLFSHQCFYEPSRSNTVHERFRFTKAICSTGLESSGIFATLFLSPAKNFKIILRILPVPIHRTVFICARVRQFDTEYLLPDLWLFFLPPDEHIARLHIEEKIWDLDLNIGCFMVDGE